MGIYFSEKIDNNTVTIHNSSVLNEDSLDKNSIDLIITSPPYNLGIDYLSNDDSLDYDDYLKFSVSWLHNCFIWAKESCRLLLNVPVDLHKGGHKNISSDISSCAILAGWNYYSTVIWNKGNISKRTAWGSWLSASAPNVIAPVEVILVLYKDKWKKTDGSKRSDITKEEFMDWTNGMWTFNSESKKRIGHPAPFPRELPKRCIKLFSYVGDTVLDPFMGSGTTLIESVLNGRDGIGLDIDPTYCSLAKDRLISTISPSK